MDMFNSAEKNVYYSSVDVLKIHDLSQLEEITLENVLRCLIERYKSKICYTFAGAVLLSLNPCSSNSRKSLSDFDQTFHFPEGRNFGTTDFPHVLTVGEKCLHSLCSVGNDQVVVVSGDSGAGKTTVTQQLLCYFIDKSCQALKNHAPNSNSLDKKIYYATIILEALGNASTSVNTNSSRFGRFIQLNYNGNSGNIIGAKIRTCLLEKHRASKWESSERTFHIFYYVVAGLESGMLRTGDILSEKNEVETWRTEIPKYFIQGLQDTDPHMFQCLSRAFQALNLSPELVNVFRIVYGIMLLLNLEFVPLKDGESSSEFNQEEYVEYIPEDEALLERIASIFSVDSKTLSSIAVSRTICVGGRGRRQSIFRKPCDSAMECTVRILTCVTALYDALFTSILKKLNYMFEVDGELSDGNSDDRMLSLLDLYGFESLSTNRLEQLCINYANERLQLVHMQTMKMYAIEIDDLEDGFTPMELIKVEADSLERVKTIHESVFLVLNDACLLNRKVSEFETYQRLRNSAAEDKFIEAKSVHPSSCNFIIRHYASQVEYNFSGMVEKNSDNIPLEFVTLFNSSSDAFIRELLNDTVKKEHVNETFKRLPGKGNSKREKTILQRFKASVDELVFELSNEAQDIHYIRCIRPTDNAVSGGISSEVVKKQLFSSGIVDVIQITGNGFPIRIQKSKFPLMFPGIFFRFFHGYHTIDGFTIGLELDRTKDFRIGRQKFFLTEETFTFLKKLEPILVRTYARKIQNLWKSFMAQRKENEERFNQTKLNYRDASIANVSAEDPVATSHDSPVRDLLSAGDSAPLFPKSQFSNISRCKSFQSTKLSVYEMTFIIESLNLRFQNGILTRGQLFKNPVRFHTRKTVLPFAHCAPKVQGLNELLGNEVTKLPQWNFLLNP